MLKVTQRGIRWEEVSYRNSKMTSLSLQLNRLGSGTGTGTGSDGGIFGGQDVDPVLLEGLAEKAFVDLSALCPTLGEFQSRLFQGNSSQQQNEDDDDEWLSDLLPLLSPFLLHESCQYLIQFLITRHSLDVLCPDALILSALPVYSYSIFHSLVAAAVPHGSSSSRAAPQSQWLSQFHQQCHPCTKIGLLKHMAQEYGFFKMCCEFMVKMERHQRR